MSNDDDALANPYPGLRPFQADETHLFFGRDTQTAELLRRLQSSRFLAIVGTSGSGKSSLVRAGMLQGLFGGLLAGGSHWRVVDMRPGTNPIGNLAAALDRPGALRDEGCSAEHSFTDATLRRSDFGLVQAVREARLGPRERVLVLVDQFEELFRALNDGAGQHVDDDAIAFVQLLLAAAQQQALPIYVALTMRSDFLGECARFRDLPEAISDGQYLIPRLTRDQLREAITGPAAVHGVALSDRLVDRLLNDLGGNPDQLPILQHALMRTWDLWLQNPAHGQTIDLHDYERIGGMAHALSLHADEVLASLGDGPTGAPARPRRVAECLFKALATIGPGGQEVRRFASVQSVADIAGVPADAVIAVVEAFRAPGSSFLMPPVGEPLSAATDIDISHESLIRNWTTVRGWLAEEAESQRRYERLSSTAALHAQGQAGLLPGPDLSRALAWRERQRPTAAWAHRYDGDYAQTMDFIDDSAARAASDERVSAGRNRAVMAALVLSLFVALGLSLNWIAGEYARRSDLEFTAHGAMQRIELARDLKTAYDQQGSAVDAETCEALGARIDSNRDAIDTSAAGLGAAPQEHALRPVYNLLCDRRAASKAVTDWFDPFFAFTETLARGEIEKAEELARQLGDDFLRLPALVLLDAKKGLQFPGLGRERQDLTRLHEALVGVMAKVHADYRETGQLDSDRCSDILVVINGSPGWAHLSDIAGWLCEPEDQIRENYFHISGLMLEGDVAGAQARNDEGAMDRSLDPPVEALRAAMLDLQAPQDRAERTELVELLDARARRQTDGIFSASARNAAFRHPVHQHIASKLQTSPGALKKEEEWLLHAYRQLGQDREYRERVLRGEALQDMATDPPSTPDPPSPPERPAIEGVPVFYTEMVRRAAEHESADWVGQLADNAGTYGPSLLILVSWPAWGAWRQRLRRRGTAIAARPGALRRALAAVIDSGIALVASLAVGHASREIFFSGWMYGVHMPYGLIDWGSVLLGVVAGCSYLLFGDALQLRHQRSLGKIAFHLRPVRVGAGGAAGHITLSVALRRGAIMALFVSPLMLLVLLGVTTYDNGFLRELAAYFVFPLLLLYWLPMALMRDGRTWSDRWSGTSVIDAESDGSFRVDAPPRYLETIPATAVTSGPGSSAPAA